MPKTELSARKTTFTQVEIATKAGGYPWTKLKFRKNCTEPKSFSKGDDKVFTQYRKKSKGGPFGFK